MSLVGVFFGQSDGEKRAEQARLDAEDRLMAVHQQEKADLGFHCEAEGERIVVFLTRLRDLAAVSKASSDRNFVTLIIVGAALMIKGVTAADLKALLTAIFGAL